MKVYFYGAGSTMREHVAKFGASNLTGVLDSYTFGNKLTIGGKTFKVADPQNADIDFSSEEVFVVITTTAIEEVKNLLINKLKLSPKQISSSPVINHVAHALNSILISCPSEKNAGLYRVEPDSNFVEKLVDGNFRGLCYYGEDLYAADENLGVGKFNKELDSFEVLIGFENKNLHDIKLDETSGRMYIVNTFDDKIEIYDVKTLSKLNEINLKSNSAPDMHHVNSIFISDGYLYGSMFSELGIWRNKIWDNGCVMRWDLSDLSATPLIVTQNLSQPHSVVMHENGYYFCNSMLREIRKNSQVFSTTLGYPRGLLVDDDHLVVGCSEIRRLENFTHGDKFVSARAYLQIFSLRNRNSQIISLDLDAVYDIVYEK